MASPRNEDGTMTIWEIVLGVVCGGGVLAGLLKILEGVTLHKLGRKAKAEDSRAESLKVIVAKIAELKEHSANDFNRINRMESALQRSSKADQIIMQSLLALLAHAETGNDTGKMHEAKAALEKYLTEAAAFGGVV